MTEEKESIVSRPFSSYGRVLCEGLREFQDKMLAALPENIAGSLNERMFRLTTFFVGLILRSDGTFFLVYQREADLASLGAKVEPQLAHQILVWHDKEVHQDACEAVFREAGLDDFSVTQKRNEALDVVNLTDAQIAERREQILRNHDLNDNQVASHRIAIYGGLELDNSSIVRKRALLLEEKGLA